MRIKENRLICLTLNARKITLVFAILDEIGDFAEIRCRFCGEALKRR